LIASLTASLEQKLLVALHDHGSGFPPLLDDDEPELLADDEPELLADDEPELLADDEPELLADDEPELLPRDDPSEDPPLDDSPGQGNSVTTPDDSGMTGSNAPVSCSHW
jgi:hypothetical protein